VKRPDIEGLRALAAKAAFDAALVAAMRNALPALLDYVEELENQSREEAIKALAEHEELLVALERIAELERGTK
jgi:hypothetical protein